MKNLRLLTFFLGSSFVLAFSPVEAFEKVQAPYQVPFSYNGIVYDKYLQYRDYTGNYQHLYVKEGYNYDTVSSDRLYLSFISGLGYVPGIKVSSSNNALLWQCPAGVPADPGNCTKWTTGGNPMYAPNTQECTPAPYWSNFDVKWMNANHNFSTRFCSYSAVNGQVLFPKNIEDEEPWIEQALSFSLGMVSPLPDENQTLHIKENPSAVLSFNGSVPDDEIEYELKVKKCDSNGISNCVVLASLTENAMKKTMTQMIPVIQGDYFVVSFDFTDVGSLIWRKQYFVFEDENGSNAIPLTQAQLDGEAPSCENWLCDLFIPRSDYFITQWEKLKTNIDVKFAFFGQIQSAVFDAPPETRVLNFPSIKIGEAYTTAQPLFNPNTLNPNDYADIRFWIATMLWCSFAFWMFRELTSIFSS